MKHSERRGQGTRIPLILGMLITSSALLLLFFSLNPPPDAKAHSKSHLVRTERDRTSFRDIERIVEPATHESTPLPYHESDAKQTGYHSDATQSTNSIHHSSLRAASDIFVVASPTATSKPGPPNPIEALPPTSPTAIPTADTTLTKIKHLNFVVNSQAARFTAISKIAVDRVLMAADSSEEGIDVVEVLHSALQTGTVPAPARSTNTDFASICEVIKKMVRSSAPQSFVEITTAPLPTTIAHLLSLSFPRLTSILIQIRPPVDQHPNSAEQLHPDSNAKSVKALQAATPGNLFATKPRTDLSILLPGQFDCIQSITSLQALVNSQLPFEFEESLGRHLCRCNTTFIPKDLPTTGFFAFWESTTSLLLASTDAATGLCSITFDTSSAYFTSTRYTHIIVQRLGNTTALTRDRGLIAVSDIIGLPLTATSWHHIISSLNDYYSLGSTYSEAALDKLVARGGMVCGPFSAAMHDFRMLRSYVSEEDDQVTGGVSKPTSKPSPHSYVSVNASFSNSNVSSLSISASTLPRRRLLSYADKIRSIAEELSHHYASFPSTWELMEFIDPIHSFSGLYRASLGKYNDLGGAPNDTVPSPAPFPQLGKDARLGQRAMQEREEYIYHKWAAFLASENMFEDVHSSPIVLLAGSRVSMLSSTLSQSLSRADERGILISVHTDQASIQPHSELLSLLGLTNTLVCSTKLSVASIVALLAAPDLIDVSIVMPDIVIRLWAIALLDPTVVLMQSSSEQCTASMVLLDQLLGAIIALSTTTYIELPSFAALSSMIKSTAPHCLQGYIDRYYPYSSTDGERGGSIESLHLAALNLPRRTTVRISAKQFIPSSNSSSALFKVIIKPGNEIDKPHSPEHMRKTPSRGVSLYSLLQLGIDPSQKKQLLGLFIDMPLWHLAAKTAQEALPWKIIVRHGRSGDVWSLWYGESGRSAHSELGQDGHSERDKIIEISHTSSIGVQSGRGGYVAERARAKYVYQVLRGEFESHGSEVAGGQFSFVEHGSGYGFLSTLVAHQYPNATILSLENNANKATQHVEMVTSLGLDNVAVCTVKGDTATAIKNIVESPELFRFQVTTHSILDSFASTPLSQWGLEIGTLLSAALTTFLHVPPSDQVSLAMEVFFGRPLLHPRVLNMLPLSNKQEYTAAVNAIAQRVRLGSHPTDQYEGIDSLLILSHAKSRSGHTTVNLTPITYTPTSDNHGNIVTMAVRTPLIRCDLTNMTRRVHHHYDYAKDGHTRTYTMQVLLNETLSRDAIKSIKDPSSAVSELVGDRLTLRRYGVVIPLPLGSHPSQHKIVSVLLYRDKDSFPIPYTSIHGITLITALRLGLHPTLRDRLFKSFLRLPLYEDMAPWNVVLSGKTLDYIDYDTRNVIFDGDVPKAYQVMAVLMNYKRTVEDFQRCGSKVRIDVRLDHTTCTNSLILHLITGWDCIWAALCQRLCWAR